MKNSILKKKYLIKLILISILILFIIYLFKRLIFEQVCQKCIKIYIKKCIECSSAIIFRGLKIYDNEKTLNDLLSNKKSMSRFGDGEFLIMQGENIGFQNYNKTLAKRLKDILNCHEKNLLIGINLPYKSQYLNQFNDNAKDYYKKFLKLKMFSIAKFINKNKPYYSSTITRFYIDYEDKNGVSKYIKKLKKIWDQKDVVIVEGEKSRVGIGNDLFNNVKTIKRIICPNINAFNKYNNIINSITRNVQKNKLILIALGPTATLLAYDLYKLGYQSLDIGHIDIEYEWYLRKAKKKIKIENKFVLEAFGKDRFSRVKDKKYYDTIIERIY